MKTLIIHPQDRTTTFLQPIYQTIPDKTIISGGAFMKDIRKMIDEFNDAFSGIVSKYINEPADIIYNKVLQEYGVLAEKNPVAMYNYQRLYCN